MKLKIINIYLLLANAASLFFILRTLMDSISAVSPAQLFLTILVIAAILYSAYASHMLLMKRREMEQLHFIRYNFWYNIVQIPSISLYGFIYMAKLGVMFIATLANKNGIINLDLKLDLFQVEVNFLYNPEAHIYFLGINIVPLVIAILLNGSIEKIEKEKQDDEVRAFASQIN
ncbi:hypothetical protein [Chitinophaga caseinilytica]|uniref:hypothetical protein n=1 Tax=Chitinophaga caseinilytica TaxID=2267521 RepID=UPI003C2ADF7E